MIAAKKLMMAGSVVADPDARALIARMTPRPSPVRQRAINELIVAMKGAGSWNAMKNFYVLAAHAAQAATLNWKGVGGTLNVEGSPDFIADRGVLGSNSCVLSYQLDFSQMTHMGLGTWVNMSSLPQFQGPLFGHYGVNRSRAMMFSPHQGPKSAQQFLTASASPPDDTAVRTEFFLHASQRGGSLNTSENSRYSNNDLDDASGTRVGPSGKLSVNALHDQTGGSSSGYNRPDTGNPAARFRASWSGTPLTIAQTNALRSALTTYLQKIGAIA